MSETTMAINEQALDPTPPPETELDEASIMSSLARLQELHIVLRSLRETIPNVMRSVLLDPPSPDQLHSTFSQAANGAAQAMKHFTQLVEDSRTKEIMEKAKESRTENNDGIIGWQVTEHEDWLDVRQKDANDDDDDREKGGVVEAGDGSRPDDVNAVLDKFRSTHGGVEVTLDEESKTVNLLLPPPARITFQIQLNAAIEGQNIYRVDSKSKSKFHGEIVEAIRARTRTTDLLFLLEMLASYSDIKSRHCVKCSRLLDRNAQVPIIRSRKKIKQPDGQPASQWLALHLACA